MASQSRHKWFLQVRIRSSKLKPAEQRSSATRLQQRCRLMEHELENHSIST